TFRHGDVGGERRAAEGSEVDIDDLVARHAIVGSDSLRRFDLVRVTLTVTERQGVHRVRVTIRNRGCRGRVQAGGEEHDGRYSLHGRHPSKLIACIPWTPRTCPCWSITSRSS